MKYTRQQSIEKFVLERDYVSLEELGEKFGISINTVRRDIAQLLRGGNMVKVYGGVRAVRNPAPAMVSYADRSGSRSAEKAAIGALAARFVRDNDVIFIDSGTTANRLLPHIAERNGVTLLSNNLLALTACLGYPSLSAIAFGGQLNADTASFTSNCCSMEHLRSFNVAKAFMSATGVSIEKGATNSSSGELAIKKSVVEISGECILMADRDKFGKVALLTYAPLLSFKRVVTDRSPPGEFLSYFREHGIELLAGTD